MTITPNINQLTLIGFGEAAQAFAEGWQDRFSGQIYAFDVKTNPADAVAAKIRQRYQHFDVHGFDSSAAAIAKTDAIFSLVTADQSLAAAGDVARDIPANCLYFDCNSVAPQTKQTTADLIEAAGGRYVDVAVMAPVHPNLHRTPLLISGDHSAAALPVLKALDMSVTRIDGAVGRASSVKMIRSIMVKGLEALVAECVLSGRKAGVADIVLDSLEKSFPGFDWQTRAAYMLERMMVHGPRRAAEMNEVALTVKHLGLGGTMSEATAKWQQSIGDLNLEVGGESYESRSDAILQALADLPDDQ